MSALTVTLGADITSLRRAMAGATELVAASAKRMGRLTGSGLAGLGKGSAIALQQGFNVAGIALKASIGAAMAGGAAAVGVGMKSVMAAADFEQTKVAFATLIGDAAKAEATLARLRVLGAQTPFEFPELADAGRKLIAFGESADTVPETLRRIGDVSAGVQAPINEIAELYGKARVQGRLFAEDINQLTGRGIPVIQELAKQFGVSDSQVKKLVESGQVGFPNIEKAFIDMTSQGGKFTGMSDLMGLDADAVDTSFESIYNGWKARGAELFGINFREMANAAGEVVNGSAPQLGERVAIAAQKAADIGTGDLIDTTGLKADMGRLVDSIRETLPQAAEVKQAAAAKTNPAATTTQSLATAARLAPIVTSLGRVGGGGYVTGTLDAQRENNRLTNETNRLLTDLNRRVEKLGGTGQAAFG